MIASSIPDFATSIFTIEYSNYTSDESAFYLSTYLFLTTKLIMGLFLIVAKKLLGSLLVLIHNLIPALLSFYQQELFY
ncbi:hypothetical protein NBRC116595_41180 [Aliiglaciecola sp. NS0011-25]